MNEHELAASTANRSLTALTALSRLLPPVRGSGSIALYGIRRLYRGKGRSVLPIWPGVRMAVDPSDCLGGLLAFVPHLYDASERKAIASVLRPGDLFVDVGSNIGAYALWAARSVGPSGRVLAIEPDQENHSLLLENIRLNGFEDRVHVVRCGVSDQRQVLRLHRNVRGNCGGHNFLGVGMEGPDVPCLPLDEVLNVAAMGNIRMMKLDIEGFETRVLQCYFGRVFAAERPDYLLVEIKGGPLGAEDKQALRQLILCHGYRIVQEGANALFRREDASD